jgi:hypothetical protein
MTRAAHHRCSRQGHREQADACYLALRVTGWLAVTSACVAALWLLFFVMLGDFSFRGTMLQLENFASRYVAADGARQDRFRLLFWLASARSVASPRLLPPPFAAPHAPAMNQIEGDRSWLGKPACASGSGEVATAGPLFEADMAAAGPAAPCRARASALPRWRWSPRSSPQACGAPGSPRACWPVRSARRSPRSSCRASSANMSRRRRARQPRPNRSPPKPAPSWARSSAISRRVGHGPDRAGRRGGARRQCPRHHRRACGAKSTPRSACRSSSLASQRDVMGAMRAAMAGPAAPQAARCSEGRAMLPETDAQTNAAQPPSARATMRKRWLCDRRARGNARGKFVAGAWRDDHALLINTTQSLPTGRSGSTSTAAPARRLCRVHAAADPAHHRAFRARSRRRSPSGFTACPAMS